MKRKNLMIKKYRSEIIFKISFGERERKKENCRFIIT